jgi:two-component system, NtrC family, response regulator GlrR
LLAGTKGFTFSRLEYHAKSGLNPATADFGSPDVVVATLGAFQETNTELFVASLRRSFPYRSLVVTTTHPDTFDFFSILEMGVSDFLLPPLRRSELLARLMRQARMRCRPDVAVQKLKEHIGLKQIIGEDATFLDKVRRVPRFASCDASVLICGESGTGKEVFARAIHYLSPRADQPFVPVNCGALPENLVESEIFGHKRGAFTGAASDQAGLIREAEGGTLFLDEIDTLTPQAQVKLLRFLQDGEYRPVGSQQILHANIRVVAAANADFSRVVREGKFREDLYYRLNVLALRLPPLRERSGDILLLAYDFLEKQAAITRTHPKNLSLSAINRLLTYSWPGNVRELQNVLMRSIVLSDRDSIDASDVDLPEDGVPAEAQSFRAMKSRLVWRFEHDFLTATLRAHQGNITHAAFAVKKNRRAFWELLRKHGLLANVRSV